MKLIRKKWDKDSLIEFLNVKDLYDQDKKCQVLCHEEGCFFETSVRELPMSYTNIAGEDDEPDYQPYWECECPVCLNKIILTKRDFNLGSKT